MRKKEGGDQLSDLTRKSEELASQHQDFGNRLRQEFGAESTARRTGTPGPKAEELAAENDELRRKEQELEKAMQAAARDLAATDRDAAGKIRRALGELQQDGLDQAMRNSADYHPARIWGRVGAAGTDHHASLEQSARQIERGGGGGGQGQEQRAGHCSRRSMRLRRFVGRWRRLRGV